MKWTVVVLAFLSLSWASAVRPAEAPADLVIVGATVYTLDPQKPRVEAVAIRDGRIVATGTSREIEPYRGPSTSVIDAAGLTVLPGLVDAHAHLAGLGNKLAEIDLLGTKSAEEVRRIVVERAEKALPGEWLRGRGWDQNDWEAKEFPTWKALAATESHPVYLRRVDGHAAWVNRKTLAICGITKDTPDPDGGKILRDEAGEPTGVLMDRATDLVTEKMPPLTTEERMRRLKLAVAECRRCGLTGVHDAGVGAADLDALRRLDESGELGLRVYAMLDADEADFAESYMKRVRPADAGGLVAVRAVKLYADGALGSRGAALIEPYADDPGNRGLLVRSREELLRWTRLALDHGYQVCTHAIGDAANRLMLDIYEEALRGSKAADARLRIEHAQVLDAADIRRFGRLGVIASMQPTHATSDMEWAPDRLGPVRVKGSYAWRQLADAGCTIACGSDFPVEGVNPLWGIYAAVTRTDHEGRPAGGWRREECLTVDEALRGFTVNAAYASFSERVSGRIEPDMKADITVVDRDIFAVSPEGILDCRVAYTIVDGEVVYSTSAAGGREK